MSYTKDTKESQRKQR